jgi:hypothetical protein
VIVTLRAIPAAVLGGLRRLRLVSRRRALIVLLWSLRWLRALGMLGMLGMLGVLRVFGVLRVLRVLRVLGMCLPGELLLLVPERQSRR